MSKKTKKAESKHAIYEIGYTKEDVKELVKRLNKTILDRTTLINLVKDKMQAKKKLLLAESAVSNYCIADWLETIDACQKQIKILKVRAK